MKFCCGNTLWATSSVRSSSLDAPMPVCSTPDVSELSFVLLDTNDNRKETYTK